HVPRSVMLGVGRDRALGRLPHRRLAPQGAGLAAAVAERHPARHPVEPRPRRDLVVQVAPAPIRGEEHVLHRVVERRGVHAHATRSRPHERELPPIDALEAGERRLHASGKYVLRGGRGSVTENSTGARFPATAAPPPPRARTAAAADRRSARMRVRPAAPRPGTRPPAPSAGRTTTTAPPRPRARPTGPARREPPGLPRRRRACRPAARRRTAVPPGGRGRADRSRGRPRYPAAPARSRRRSTRL